jgi:hypothetical protein
MDSEDELANIPRKARSKRSRTDVNKEKSKKNKNEGSIVVSDSD